LDDDPAGPADRPSYGSYLVFRKLAQDAARFAALVDLAAWHAGDGDREIAAARMIGRFRDGTPLALSPVPLGAVPAPDDFDYQRDRDGARCPLNAHIRIMNPRGESARALVNSPEEERGHRIARRSIPYAGGLLFMCFQSNIANQFEYLQRMLARGAREWR